MTKRQKDEGRAHAAASAFHLALFAQQQVRKLRKQQCQFIESLHFYGNKNGQMTIGPLVNICLQSPIHVPMLFSGCLAFGLSYERRSIHPKINISQTRLSASEQCSWPHKPCALHLGLAHVKTKNENARREEEEVKGRQNRQIRARRGLRRKRLNHNDLLRSSLLL